MMTNSTKVKVFASNGESDEKKKRFIIVEVEIE